MTRNIRKHAPEGAEYFQIAKDSVIYYKLDDNDLVWVWFGGDWELHCEDIEWLLTSPDIHNLHMPLKVKALLIGAICGGAFMFACWFATKHWGVLWM